jgi:hypothetical protein
LACVWTIDRAELRAIEMFKRKSSLKYTGIYANYSTTPSRILVHRGGDLGHLAEARAANHWTRRTSISSQKI